jgi:integrase
MGRRPRGTPPAYKRHKATNQAYVHVNGRRRYLGVYGTPASREEYARVLAEWREGSAPPAPRRGCTVSELWAAFRGHAETHYRRRDGTPTCEPREFGYSLAPVLALFAHEPADRVRAPQLEEARARMVAAGWSRRVVNQRVGRVRRVWRWGVVRDLVDPATVVSLESLPDLEAGRTAAPDHPAVPPVDVAVVAATLPHLASDQLRAMAGLQLLTSMRPGEVCLMRSGDVYRGGAVPVGKRLVPVPAGAWVYAVAAKMRHARKRQVQLYVLGPRARALLLPWLRADPGEYLFSPLEAARARDVSRRAARKTPVQPSQRHRRKAVPLRRPGDHYTPRSYAHAIARAVLKANSARACDPCRVLEPADRCPACKAAALPHWHPHQLRHSSAGIIDAHAGLEDTSKVLGHTSPDITLLYIEKDLKRVAEIMEAIG